MTLPMIAKDPGDTPLDPGDAAILEDEAARHHNPDWPSAPLQRPPPYVSQSCTLALLPPMLSPSTLSEAEKRLSTQIIKVKQILKMSAELTSLQATLQNTVFDPPSKPSKKITNKTPKSKNLTFPVLTRSTRASPPPTSTSEATSEAPATDSEDDNENAQENESEDEEQPAPTTKHREFHKLQFKNLKELNMAVKTYGPNAPYTLSVLETLSRGGQLLPSE